MSVSSRQIGWNTEEKLLWEISKLMEKLSRSPRLPQPVPPTLTYYLQVVDGQIIWGGVPAGGGDVLGPALNTDGYIPLWNGSNSKTLANGIVNNSTNWNTAFSWGNHASAGYFTLDQTVPQSVINGAPSFEGIDFDTSPSVTTEEVARLTWSGSEKTLQFGVEGGTIDVNKEIFDYYVDSSEDGLVDGDVVSIVSISGNRQAVDLTDPTSVTNATACIGMVTHVNVDNTVRITKKGRVHNLDTQGMTEGLPVYVDAANPGKYTQSVPDAPDYFIHVGIVEVANQNNGIIDVDIRVSPRMSDLSDVNGTALDTTGQIPVWNNTAKYFDFNYNITDFLTEVIAEDDSNAASALNVGKIRYRTSGNNSYCDMSMQVGVNSYSWVNIVQNNW